MNKNQNQNTKAPRTRGKKRMFHGIVISDKMDKTIVVKVDRIMRHPRYGKRYKVSKNYKVHDAKNQYKQGDKVRFYEDRPISKCKRWRVIYNSL